MSEFFQVKFITLKMEGCCSFKALVGGVCGYNAASSPVARARVIHEIIIN